MTTPSNDDYDTPWKDALTRYFPEFMAFYFPAVHAQVDWTKPHIFLDQELAQIVQDAELGKRLVDRLVQVTTREGSEEWVCIHVEVQGSHDIHFAERMFTYNYRLYDLTVARWQAWPFWRTRVRHGSRKALVTSSSIAKSVFAFRSSSL